MRGMTIIPASPDHLPSVALRMRQADRDEVWAATRRTPEEALSFALEHSDCAYTVMIDGVPEAMFGAAELDATARIGAAWLLGTDAIETEFRAFLRLSVLWSAKLLAPYAALRNFVHDKNAVSIRWLEWLGASFSSPMPIGADGEMFRLFELRRANV